MTWQKGQSGNPAGLTVLQARTRRMIEGLSIRAVERIEKLMQSDNEAIALAASKEILARVVPIPKTGTLTIEHNASPHLSALVTLAASTAARVQGVPANPVQVIDLQPDAPIEAQSDGAETRLEPVNVDVEGTPNGG